MGDVRDFWCLLRERFDDGAIRTVIAVAAVDQVLKGGLHGLQFLELLVKLDDVGLSERTHLPARSLAVLPQT